MGLDKSQIADILHNLSQSNKRDQSELRANIERVEKHPKAEEMGMQTNHF